MEDEFDISNVQVLSPQMIEQIINQDKEAKRKPIFHNLPEGPLSIRGVVTVNN